MEIKKTPKADLENKKSTWLLVGYVIVLAFMFVAFEWTKRDIKIDTSQAITDLVFEEEIIPITEQPEQVATFQKHWRIQAAMPTSSCARAHPCIITMQRCKHLSHYLIMQR